MSRTIRSRVTNAADAATDPSSTEDSYLAKVVRYIPGEIVAAYIAAFNALKEVPGIPTERVLWGTAVVLTILTPVWTLYATHDPQKPKPYFQAAAATIAFVVWMFAIPAGPFNALPWYHSVYGFLALISSTFLIPLLEKIIVRPAAPPAPLTAAEERLPR